MVYTKTYHGAIGDKSDEGIRWNKAKTDDNGIAESLQVLLV